MSYEFPSEAWIEQFQDRLNDNETYREAASDWGIEFNGDFIFEVEAADGLAESHYYFVGLEAGDCTDAYRTETPEDEPYGFWFAGAYDDWKRMVEGDVGAIDGLMSGTFELEGDMQKVLQATDAAAALVDTTTEIESDFVA
ncbi:SCP2 sterol-binding domain-containing protein [Halorientalis marina]|jgi:putative sterol carrier protein|uniref:SCP2 sterol-binding domain-containing protein n=1 Tax=Halorientalis marina TaxID=2931976 RepID=UPI001FF3A53A|nr:SCP2 sterol-binding domain-containing protein [Halorientalis marina]